MCTEVCSLQCEIGSNLNVRECFIRVWFMHGVVNPADMVRLYKPSWKSTQDMVGNCRRITTIGSV